jgi:hypothetical protein
LFEATGAPDEGSRQTPSASHPAGSRRTIARFFNPGGDPRARAIIERVSTLPDSEASALIRRVEEQFGRKHRNIREIFLQHYRAVREFVPAPAEASEARQLLIGAYFTMEYSVESAALFNPSTVHRMNREHRRCAPGTIRG